MCKKNNNSTKRDGKGGISPLKRIYLRRRTPAYGQVETKPNK